MLKLFIKNECQRGWLDKLKSEKERIVAHAAEVDEEASFPYEAFAILKQIGYTSRHCPSSEGLCGRFCQTAFPEQH